MVNANFNKKKSEFYRKFTPVSYTRLDSMIITNDQNNNDRPNNYILTRESGFKVITELTKGQNCNGAETHPINGELYFNSWNAGQVFRYDFTTQETTPLFTIQDSGWEFHIQFHPSGNYAYIVVVNQHYILRSDYDWKTKRLTTPYIVCGQQEMCIRDRNKDMGNGFLHYHYRPYHKNNEP